MKILAVARFDPAGVASSHRRVLRSRGVDFRLAVGRRFMHTVDADWTQERFVGAVKGNALMERLPCDTASLAAFAAEADVLVFYPGIGEGYGLWADKAEAPQWDAEPPAFPLFGIDWTAVNSRARRVAYFHGSVNAMSRLDEYRRRFAGWSLATSTLDYAGLLPAAYLPPLIEVDLPPATPRIAGERLRVAHTPTNPKIASSEAFLAIVRLLNVDVIYETGVTHGEAMAAKRRGHVYFDHLRGCFSVNTIEAAALGLGCIFGMSPAALEAAKREDMPLPFQSVSTVEDVGRLIDRLAHRPEETRAAQVTARQWYEKNLSSWPVGERLVRFFSALEAK